jgi:esterase/lipase
MIRWLRITLLAVLTVFIVAVIAVLVVGYKEGRAMVMIPQEDRERLTESPADYGMPYEEVTVTTEDGLKLVGWYVPTKNGAAIIAQHGYKDDREDALREGSYLYQNGYGVLFSTFRAHDLSEGEMFTFGKNEMQDLEAWYQYVLTRDGVNPDNIGMLGKSMGGALSIKYAALNENIKAVVADCAFSSIPDVVAIAVPELTGLPAFPFAPVIVFWAEQILGYDIDEFDTKVWVRDICGRPIKILQGGADKVISVSSGQLIFDAACEPKEFWFEPTAGHTICDELVPERCAELLVPFFNRYVLGE